MDERSLQEMHIQKLTHEKVDCCPICNMHLGRLPTEKLSCVAQKKERRAKSAGTGPQTSRADDQTLEASLDPSFPEELQDSKVIPESEESIRDLGLVPQVVSQSGKSSLALPDEVSDIPTPQNHTRMDLLPTPKHSIQWPLLLLLLILQLQVQMH
ncbi:hypothetical protein NC651_012683 [Populus alba x Populus x berolinensis]|nr:hypothetical protein NC651_012683 [Populus alba x Populus x berolinensis]